MLYGSINDIARGGRGRRCWLKHVACPCLCSDESIVTWCAIAGDEGGYALWSAMAKETESLKRQLALLSGDPRYKVMDAFCRHSYNILEGLCGEIFVGTLNIVCHLCCTVLPVAALVGQGWVIRSSGRYFTTSPLHRGAQLAACCPLFVWKQNHAVVVLHIDGSSPP